MDRKLLRITVLYFSYLFLLSSSISGCLGWLNGIFLNCKIRSLNASVSSDSTGNNHELNKGISEKNRHENLFIIGDIGKCKEVMKKLGADSCSEENEMMIYNKKIIDDNCHTTFKFYLCGNDVWKCEKIYKNDKKQSSFFFFFVDITDSNLENRLVELLQDFKQEFENEISRFFLILLKTDSQLGGDIKVDAAEEFCKKNKLKFFGVIDSKNIIWDFEDKSDYFDVIKEFEYQSNNNNYKLGEIKDDEESTKDYDIWGMFLCGVKREEIRNQLMHNHYIWRKKLTGSYY